MLNIIDRPEKLWQESAQLAKQPGLIESELFGNSDDHFVLAYGPVAQRNQYQALLYSEYAEFNVSILPVHTLELCGEIPWPGKVVCHFHWLHDKTKNAKTAAEANDAVIYWKNLLQRIKENDHKIVWTVHNVMPHETVWIEHDQKIHQMMADAADALHVMASDSAKLTAFHYTLDESKMFLVPHPTYEGAQPDQIPRDSARTQLDIAGEDFVFLSFGAIMEYKGYDRLMNAYDGIRNNIQRKTRLIIAGLPSDKNLVEKIRLWAQGKQDVILDMTPVPNEKLQVYFRAADFAVCPYRLTMNSGAAMMAITFDLPVLGPNSGGFLDIERNGCGLTFDNESETDLQDTMLNLMVNNRILSENLVKAKMSFSPSAVSRLFFQNIKKLII